MSEVRVGSKIDFSQHFIIMGILAKSRFHFLKHFSATNQNKNLRKKHSILRCNPSEASPLRSAHLLK